jgi:hypothetical protein
LLSDLKPIVTDDLCIKSTEIIEKKIKIFEKLRTAMKIAQHRDKDGLNNDGLEVNIKTIENEIVEFRKWLIEKPEYETDKDYQKKIGQIDKYWTKLFADPIEIKTPKGIISIQPQRNNNIMEQFFRNFKRAHRGTTGNNSMAKKLQTMFADTPLVKNLENEDYWKILLGEKSSLEEVFAQIDYKTYISENKEIKMDEEKISLKIKKIIKNEKFEDIFLSFAS